MINSQRDQCESQCYRLGVYSFSLSWQRSTQRLCRPGWKVKGSLCAQRTRKRTWCQRSCSAWVNHEAGSHHPDSSCRFRAPLSGNPHRSKSLACRAFPLWYSHWGKFNLRCPCSVLCFSCLLSARLSSDRCYLQLWAGTTRSSGLKSGLT